jgi:hypothetical protein
MELIESPNGQYDDGSGNMVDYPLNFYYALHADLDPTLKADYAQDWSGMNTDIQDVLFPPPLPNYFRIAFFDENSPSTPKGGTVIPRITENPQNATLEYSINGGKKWISFANNDNINVTAGDGGEILFRGTNRTSLRDNFSTKNSADKKWTITPESGGKTKVAGNIMLLLDYNIPPAAVGRGGFMYMFDGCTSLVDASKLELPATTLDEGRNYAFMFQNCTSLVSAPELPATTLSEECYTSMFEGCTSLVNGPSVLPANTIEDYSCEKMFAGCRLLEKAPDLLATSVNNGGCYQMFKGCIGLVQGPSELSATEVGELGYDSMFYGCTALEDAPPILATRWYSYGDPFVSMFSGCTSLKSITVSFTTWPDEQDEIKNWVWGVQTQSGTFTYPTGLQVEYGTSRIPQNWTLNPQ